MTPIRNEILFKPFYSDGITAGGLIVPENCKRPLNKGTIISVGHGTPKRPMKLKVGMVAHRVQSWGEPYILDGELHFLMDENAILAVE